MMMMLYDFVVDDCANRIEPEYVVADAARATCLDLVFVSKELASGLATTIVENRMSEHAEQSRLARVDVAHHSHAHLYEVFRVG